METVLSYVTELDFEKISEYDLVLIGSPNHIGRPTRTVKKLIDKLGELDLKEKRIAVFDTYMSKDFEKAVKKMEKRIGKKIPGSDGSPKSVEGKVKKRCAAPEHNPPAGRTLEGDSLVYWTLNSRYEFRLVRSSARVLTSNKQSSCPRESARLYMFSSSVKDDLNSSC